MKGTAAKKVRSRVLAKKEVVARKEWTLGFLYRGREQQEELVAGKKGVKEMTKGWRKAWKAPTPYRRYPDPGWAGWSTEAERGRHDAEVKEEPVDDGIPRQTRELQQRFRDQFPSPLEGPMRFAQKHREAKGREYRSKDWPRDNPKATGCIRAHRWMGNGHLRDRQLELLRYEERTGEKRWTSYFECGPEDVEEFFDHMRREAKSRKKGKLKLCCSLCLAPRCGVCGAGECRPEGRRVDSRRKGMRCRHRGCLSRLKANGEWNDYAEPTEVVEVGDETETEEGYDSGVPGSSGEGEERWEEEEDDVESVGVAHVIPVEPDLIPETEYGVEECEPGAEEVEEECIVAALKEEKEEEDDEVEIIGCGVKREGPMVKVEQSDEWREGPGNESVCLGLCRLGRERPIAPDCDDQVPARMIDFTFRCPRLGCGYEERDTSGSHYRHLRRHYGATRADNLMKAELENYIMGVEWRTDFRCPVDDECPWKGSYQLEGWYHLRRHKDEVEERWGRSAPVLTAMQRAALELWQWRGERPAPAVAGPKMTVALSWIVRAREEHVGWVEVEDGVPLERGREVSGATEMWLEINKGGGRENRRWRVRSWRWEEELE